MNRREAIIKMAMMMGATTLVGPRLFAAAMDEKSSSATVGFTADDVALLDEIGDTIIPATDVPGAKSVKIGSFITMMVNDCYAERDQAVFKTGLKKLASDYQARFNESFLTGSAANRTAFLNDLDHVQKEQSAQMRRDRTFATESPHYFRIMKELTIVGYFSSEVGATKALRFMEVPGHFDGAMAYKKGDRAFFS